MLKEIYYKFKESNHIREYEINAIVVLFCLIYFCFITPRLYNTYKTHLMYESISNNPDNPFVSNSILYNFDKEEHKEHKEKIELNTSDTTELKKVYGIGSYYSGKIVRYRERLGGFYSVEQLKEIRMREGTYERIAPQLKADTSLIRKINLDTIGFKDLLRHPYFDYEQTKRVFRLRKRNKHITADDLLKEKIINKEEFLKVKIYCAD